MREYEIWSEGFRATGESGGAVYHGSMMGNSFRDACDRFAETNPDFKGYYRDGKYWGCRLFETQSQAMESFG